MERPRLLAVGFGVEPGGFSRVVHSLMSHLSRRFEIHHVAINYKGPPRQHPWAIYPNDRRGDSFGVKAVEAIGRKVRPDIVWLYNNPWVLGAYQAAVEPLRNRAVVIGYVPLDGRIVEPDFLPELAFLDRLVVFNQFARREIAAGLAKVAGDPAIADFPAITVIPHGIDRRSFRPTNRAARESARARLRSRLAPGRDGLRDRFWVLNANANCPRKRLDLTLEGFAHFAEDKQQHVALALHCADTIKPDFSILERSEELGIRHLLAWEPSRHRRPRASDATLNRIYNASDVGINTSVGEGWGLVSLEHATTGAAQIVPDHTACRELWRDAGLLLPIVRVSDNPAFLIDAQIVSPDDVAQALQVLFEDHPLRRKRGEAARAVAARPEYQWRHVAERWARLFDACLDGRRSPG